ncbi:DNA polymerase delta subunit 4 [Quillaja saponaria]|uniref:DNA polymerase delta subunit 4 n=1 Tax=Quillaja saponaria TaxID=32244 RepID=A0AAD7QJF4_QUISA|nr:DNA polymerase delta subunit 4 [Quillaja saponaria]KAJ7982605.1 DNA polymerase delta subunit 4 [Quillaja saponaria]
MEMPRGSMKGFYKQRKNTKSSSKNKSSISSTTTKKSPRKAATFGSDISQSPALISHGVPDLKDDYDANEDLLRKFDMNMTYGPCLGLTRLERWERARNLGLNPPKEIEGLVSSGKVRTECLWDGLI